MSSYNKQKGSKFETDVMKYLRKLGHFAERLAKAGANEFLDKDGRVCRWVLEAIKKENNG